MPFNVEGLGFQWEISSGFGSEVEVRLDPSNTVARAFVSLDWEGVPLRDEGKDEEAHIKLDVEWLDEDGTRIDPGTLAQGTTFWGHIRVENDAEEFRLEEVALTQLLPAGWEIENTRLAKAALPGWMNDWRLNAEEYLDIRDDRVNWFFDLPRGGQTARLRRQAQRSDPGDVHLAVDTGRSHVRPRLPRPQGGGDGRGGDRNSPLKKPILATAEQLFQRTGR